MAKTTKKTGSAKTPAATSALRSSRRMKCACASCTCTVDMDRATRRGNLVFCGEACAARACTVETCACEHDACRL
jgi:hypothetical protein